MVHTLKILPKYYKDVISGKKTFEIRKNDRSFQLDDILALKEWVEEQTEIGLKGYYTGSMVFAKITYIFDNPDYLKEGYVILGIDIEID